MKKYSLSDIDRLNHIWDAIIHIENFCRGASMQTFLIDAKLQSSVLFQFLIIGEAVANLSQDFLDNYPDVRWRQAKAFRNFIAHEYFKLKMEYVWEIIVSDLPELSEHIHRIMDIENKKG